MASCDRPATSYQEPILFLATAGIVVPLFHRLQDQPGPGVSGGRRVAGTLRAWAPGSGLSLGRTGSPSRNPEGTSRLAEFGVVFLLFTIGIELSWQRLRTLRRLVFGFGSLQVLLCTAGPRQPSRLSDRSTRSPAAAIVGLALALSSTAIVIPVLAEQKRLNTPAGRASFSALLFQDLARGADPVHHRGARHRQARGDAVVLRLAAPAGGRRAGS